MGEAFIVRRGGGSGLSANGAVLRITAETGSTIKLSKGGVTVATLASGKGHTNAANTSYADWYYPITAANYGSWAVTATKNGKTASKTVTVNSNKQYDVLLTYQLYIIKNGYIQSPFTLALNYGSRNTGMTQNYNALGYAKTLTDQVSGFVTNQVVNVNNYKSLKIDCSFDYNQPQWDESAGFGLAYNTNAVSGEWPWSYMGKQAAYYLWPGNHGTGRQTYTKDITSLQGNFYVNAYMYAAYPGANIYNFWLE